MNFIGEDDRTNPLINIARGIDRCGVNLDEIINAQGHELTELTEVLKEARVFVEAAFHIGVEKAKPVLDKIAKILDDE